VPKGIPSLVRVDTHRVMERDERSRLVLSLVADVVEVAFQRKRKSATFLGVAEDAAVLADTIVTQRRTT
jgi:hypothetical protein